MASSNNDSFIHQRLHSLDALRGFDMFWIMGADELIHKIADQSQSPFWQALAHQFKHVKWDGFRIYDLIFPLFLFLAGVSTPYSIGRSLELGKSKAEVLRKVVQRGLMLVILGIIYNEGLEIKPIAEIRFSSVLGRIGIAYMLANIIYLYFKDKAQIYWFSGLLIAYWLILKFTSAPGFPLGDLTEQGNFASYVDRSILPGRLSRGIHDTVGFFNNIPAISTALAGIITGIYLKKPEIAPMTKVKWMIYAGIGSLVLAQLWNLDFPINKNMWSSSFVLQTTGLSLILLAIFYFVIDVKGYQKWSFFFQVIGMNSILIYLSGHFLDWDYTNKALFTWLFQLLGEPYSIIMAVACVILIKWVFLRFLYEKKVFLRV
ncbi:acyltransferase family protein [Aquirufa rosea]|uniref:DUF5009 domain-containing protein n=1 Tax=Aquirufa rosea TaxID=2509241 RepID=A0A4Q1C370_9BACT|nr:DUF5009 domain-containing protein [Aquirufa rosea]RXK52658.1 DUF5009 domain-containing protein [Aquirufa rosea]